ncbi:MAG: type IV secretory system conjugative DNA transfer family protein, partial [Verrucomicrobiota bacterium]
FVTAERRRQLGNEVIVIDPFHLTTDEPDTLNPFDLLPHTDMSVEEFGLMFPSLLHPDQDLSSHREPFWDLRADDLIAGTTACILGAMDEDDHHIAKLRSTLKSDDVTYNLAVLLDTKGSEMSKLAYENLSAFVQTEERCRSGILATAQQHFSIYADPKVETSLTSTSFDMQAFQEGAPMTIYLVLPSSRLYSHRAMLRIWMSSLIALMKSRKTRPELQTLFLVDEAAQLGRMNSLIECVTLLRGYGVRTWTFWQSLNQLKKTYGLDADVIIDNCGVVQMFGITNFGMARSLGSFLGEHDSPRDLLSLDRRDQIILRPGGISDRVQKLDYLKDSMYRGKYRKNPYHAKRSAASTRSR